MEITGFFTAHDLWILLAVSLPIAMNYRILGTEGLLVIAGHFPARFMPKMAVNLINRVIPDNVEGLLAQE